MRTKFLIAGASIMVAGYLGAVIWGSYFLADLQLGVPNCNDQYAGWHFLPIGGPVFGMVAGGQCIPDTLHFEEAVMPVVFSAAQVAGLALLMVGAVGHVVMDMPAISFNVDSHGAQLTVGGTF